jgi:protein gp37
MKEATMATTSIGWTDLTLNPVIGCTHAGYTGADGVKRAHPGCDNCYAEVMCSRTLPGFEAHNACSSGGRWTGQIRVLPERLLWPFTRKEYGARKDGQQRRCFLTSLGDMGHPAVPERDWMAVQGMMLLSPWITWQDLTKRPGRQRALLEKWSPWSCIEEAWKRGLCSLVKLQTGPNNWAHVNWIHRYVSVSDQPTADALIPELLRMPAAVRGISAEPLIGAVDLRQAIGLPNGGVNAISHIDGLGYGLDHVIVGGESGRGARPCDLAWIEAIVGQCAEAGVPCFVKQLGSHHGPGKGDDMALWPEALRVQQSVGGV